MLQHLELIRLRVALLFAQRELNAARNYQVETFDEMERASERLMQQCDRVRELVGEIARLRPVERDINQMVRNRRA